MGNWSKSHLYCIIDFKFSNLPIQLSIQIQFRSKIGEACLFNHDMQRESDSSNGAFKASIVGPSLKIEELMRQFWVKLNISI